MAQLTLDGIGPTVKDLGIKRCSKCGRPYREEGFTELPVYTMNRLLKTESPEPMGICPGCKGEER